MHIGFGHNMPMPQIGGNLPVDIGAGAHLDPLHKGLKIEINRNVDSGNAVNGIPQADLDKAMVRDDALGDLVRSAFCLPAPEINDWRL